VFPHADQTYFLSLEKATPKQRTGCRYYCRSTFYCRDLPLVAVDKNGIHGLTCGGMPGRNKQSNSRGSEWRKWDLHVHTPGTKKNDQYQSNGADIWEEFCQKIEASDVQAIGITDYFSADGYFEFVGRFRALYPHSTKALFPNIELCTSDVVNAAAEEVNLHLIFNPTVSGYEKSLQNFLGNLHTNKTVAGGRRVNAAELKDRREFEEATTTREFIKDAIDVTFGKDIDLSDHLLIFTAANNDGIRTAMETVGGKRRGVKRKALITDEVDKFSHGFFGNSSNTIHYLNPHRLEHKSDLIEPKPVISGSDAHSFKELEDWLGKMVFKDGAIFKESTWIKADLTFEGLKQIIYEPEARVFIGEEPEIEARVRSNQRKYIKFLRVDQINGYDGRHGIWFKGERIDLNKELVAIIGNKGSGKSAIADVIGLLGNTHNQKYEGNGKSEELFSFLNREKFLKNRCASNFNGELHWYAGNPDRRLLDGSIDDDKPENVEYLPQKYLEKLCANIEDDEFREKLNEVVFGYIEESARFGKSNLEELIRYLSNQTEEDIKLIKESLHKENEKVIALERKLSADYKKEIEEKIRLKEEEVSANATVQPAEISKPTEGGEAAVQSAAEIARIDKLLESLGNQIESLGVEKAEAAKIDQELRQAKQAIERQIRSLNSLKANYSDVLRSVGINFDDIVTISVNYQRLDDVIEEKTNRLAEINTLLRTEEEINSAAFKGDKSAALKQSLIVQHSEEERRKNEIIDQLDRPNREYQAYLIKEADWQERRKELEGDAEKPAPETLNWLKRELDATRNIYPQALRDARQNRKIVSTNIFRKRKELVSFYDSVKQSIDREITKYSEDLGDYKISIDASLRFEGSFYDEFFRYVNQAVRGSFHGTEDGRDLLKKIVANVREWHAEEEVFSMLDTIVEHLHLDKREDLTPNENRARDVYKQMKQQKDPSEFYDFLFGFDYVQTKYDLKVDAKDLSELSPGERGGLLLIFYLMLDRREIPLVIDQPEDNLDNKSVYEILVKFLKKAKRRRQIIMVTHNPNLAVVADAEQIIHVSIDKKKKNDFDFRSGAIEHPDINKRVVDILEGTRPAFDNRRLKYRKHNISHSV
jgi:ABC-type lipoprotein export system ATPase subunit